ncbi:hypothetical protein [Rhizobium rhizosphaerae]|uniref:hypothetical protein n=1 Tax=Xaviernesmea rhizosphaerae TaxID=1672749 RepID=UPI00130195D9|nr:hypothetical protein [Xaviernesmea rhizosphaerae]
MFLIKWREAKIRRRDAAIGLAPHAWQLFPQCNAALDIWPQSFIAGQKKAFKII